MIRASGSDRSTPIPAFDDPTILAELGALSAAELDELPFGVITMSLDGTVIGYSRTESNLAGLSPNRVLGLNFFTDVAPCCNNYLVAGRYEDAELDDTLDYVFTLRMKPSKVKLRLLKSAGTPKQYLLVQR